MAFLPIPGTQYRVQRIAKEVDQVFRHKLMAMGLIPGALFQVARVAPLGDPIQLTLHGYSLCLRTKDMQCLTLEAVE